VNLIPRCLATTSSKIHSYIFFSFSFFSFYPIEKALRGKGYITLAIIIPAEADDFPIDRDPTGVITSSTNGSELKLIRT
jgi:hypothetical protein